MNLKKELFSKMDPKQGSRKGSNSVFLPELISMFGSFSTDVLPEMEVS